MKTVFLALAATFLFVGSALAGDAKSLIEARNAVFLKAFNAGDGAGVAAMYTEGGMVLPPDSAAISGRKALADFWQAQFDGGLARANLKVVEARRLGPDAILEIGHYEMFDPDGNAIATGKYMVQWSKAGGAWLLDRDMWNAGN